MLSSLLRNNSGVDDRIMPAIAPHREAGHLPTSRPWHSEGQQGSTLPRVRESDTLALLGCAQFRPAGLPITRCNHLDANDLHKPSRALLSAKGLWHVSCALCQQNEARECETQEMPMYPICPSARRAPAANGLRLVDSSCFSRPAVPSEVGPDSRTVEARQGTDMALFRGRRRDASKGLDTDSSR